MDAARREAVEAVLETVVDSLIHLDNVVLAKLAPILSQAQHEVERDLRLWLAREDGEAVFTTQRLRAALVAIRRGLETIQGLEPMLVDGLRIGARNAGVLATDHLETELARFGELFDGSIIPVAIDQAIIIARGDKLLFPRFAASAARYAGDVGKMVVRELAVSRARGETMEEATVRLRTRMPQVFGAARSRAAMVARTETLNSYNYLHMIGLKELAKDDPDIRMRWDATMDRRLCMDCAELDGVIVDPGDKEGQFAMRRRTVEHPPLHPN